MISEQKSNFQTVVTLVNHHLLSRAPLSHEAEARESEREVCSSRVLEVVYGIPGGPRGKAKEGCRRREQDLGCMSFLEPVGGVLCGAGVYLI